MSSIESSGEIAVLGLGLSSADWNEKTLCILGAAEKIYLQTAQTTMIEAFQARGIAFETLDDLYEQAEDFDCFAEAAARRIVDAGKDKKVCLAVPGSPEGLPVLAALRRKAKEKNIALGVHLALGYGDNALAKHAGERGWEEQALRCFASSLPRLDPARPLAVQEIDSFLLASEVKLALLQVYPAELPVFFSRWQDGAARESEIALQDLDRLGEGCYGHTSCLLLPAVDFEARTSYGEAELYHILERLRGPGGCPWDAEQTHASLRGGLLEEAYEVADAIDQQDDDALCEELGDLLLQVYFHALIAQEQGAFCLRDVSTGISQKMIFRHPHVFAGEVVANSAEVLDRWEDLKQREKHQETVADTLEAVPKAFPALMRAAKLQKRAAKVGFDWPGVEGALEKAEEERQEWLAEWSKRKEDDEDKGRLEMEMGDWLFSLVNVARLAKIDPETALQRSNDKFMDRFGEMERQMASHNLTLTEASLDTMNEYWEIAKGMRENTKG